MSSLSYQDDISTEMLDGKIVAMSPRPAINHDTVAMNIYRIFGNYLKGKKCRTFGEVDVFLTEKDRVIPDAMIVCNKEIIKKNGIHGVPDLVVEILSPSTIKNDRGYKKELYEKCGVKEYWIIDIENRLIEVYLLKGDKYCLEGAFTIFPDYILEKMTEEEKNTIVHEFKTSLFSDLTISLEDVFDNIL